MDADLGATDVGRQGADWAEGQPGRCRPGRGRRGPQLPGGRGARRSPVRRPSGVPRVRDWGLMGSRGRAC